MDKIQRCVDHLIESIKEGDAYQRYLSCEEKLKEHPELRRKIDEFRLAAYRLNNEDTNGDMYVKIEQFEEKYKDFQKNPLVNEFLEAELDICKVLQRVGTSIQGGVVIEIPQA